jgi:ribosome-binding protein aMBF1 (putative translation factor)
MSISAAQIKEARRLLGWTQMELAVEARLSPSTISRFEHDQGRPGPWIGDQIKRTLEAAGVEFTDGVTLREGK